MLVTDAHFRSSLAVIRSLGKRNIQITGGSEIEKAIGLHSKYCHKKIIYPNPRTNTAEFLTYLYNIVSENDYECIIPLHTYTAFLLSKYRKYFSDFTRIPPPDFNVFYNAFDKTILLKIALEINIPCPRTYFHNNVNDMIDAINQYPVVVKPAKRHGIKIEICNNKSEFVEKYTYMTKIYGECIVQDYIANGGEFGVYTIFNKQSEPIALCVHKRLRSMHAYGGISTLRKTTKNEKLVNLAFKLLKTIQWSGAAMVEFRIDARDNQPKLMEINPRFWGSLQLSILSGSDFPYKLYQLTIEDNPISNLDFKEDVYCRWFLADIANVFKSSKKVKKIIELCRPDVHNDIISIKDPKPGLIALFSPPHNSSDEEPRDDKEKTWDNFIANKFH